jgi:hypothetical protein
LGVQESLKLSCVTATTPDRLNLILANLLKAITLWL